MLMGIAATPSGKLSFHDDIGLNGQRNRARRHSVHERRHRVVHRRMGGISDRGEG